MNTATPKLRTTLQRAQPKGVKPPSVGALATEIGERRGPLHVLHLLVESPDVRGDQGLLNLPILGPLRYSQHSHFLNQMRVLTQFLQYG